MRLKIRHGKELLALLLFSLIIGVGYPIGSMAAKKADVLLLLAFEYLIAMAIMLLIKREKVIDARSMKPSFVFGALTFAAVLMTYLSFYFISASLVAFLTSLGFVFTTLVEKVIFSQKAHKNLTAALALSFLGLVFIVFSNGVDISLGSGLVIGSALSLAASFGYGMQYLVGSRMTNKLDPFVSSFYTSLFICVVSFTAFELLNPFKAPIVSVDVLPYLLFLGIFATAIARVLQFFGQRKVSATTTSMIFNAIPIFAVIAGLLLGDTLNGMQIIGAILITAAVIAIST
jgi:drug/metabolite transporter (DMT)-like permease